MDPLEKFFSTASRLVIIVPLVLLVVILLIRPGVKQNKTISVTSPEEKSALSEIFKRVPQGASLDLNSQYICTMQEKQSTASISAYIKEKKLFVEKKGKTSTDFYLLKDDCVYLWKKNTFSGEKVCGVSQYIALFDTLSKFNLVQTSTLPSLVSSITNLSATGEATIDNLVESCKKSEIKDDSLFEVPRNVLFKNKEL